MYYGCCCYCWYYYRHSANIVRQSRRGPWVFGDVYAYIMASSQRQRLRLWRHAATRWMNASTHSTRSVFFFTIILYYFFHCNEHRLDSVCCFCLLVLFNQFFRRCNMIVIASLNAFITSQTTNDISKYFEMKHMHTCRSQVEELWGTLNMGGASNGRTIVCDVFFGIIRFLLKTNGIRELLSTWWSWIGINSNRKSELKYSSDVFANSFIEQSCNQNYDFFLPFFCSEIPYHEPQHMSILYAVKSPHEGMWCAETFLLRLMPSLVFPSCKYIFSWQEKHSQYVRYNFKLQRPQRFLTK